MEDDRFSWDDRKAAINPQNHDGVTFDQARVVFDDLASLDLMDNRFDYGGEERWNIIGLDANGNVLTVSYTPRPPHHHIISARKASRSERSTYFAQRS